MVCRFILTNCLLTPYYSCSMLKHILLAFVLTLSYSSLTFAQHTAIVTGTFTDSKTGTPLAATTASVYLAATGKVITGAVANGRGNFTVQNVGNGKYYLVGKLVGFDSVRANFTVNGEDTIRLGVLKMLQSSVRTKDVVIEEMAERMTVKGDTVEFNANQYKTDKNASADEMVKKMAGIEVQNGQVKAQGENVKRVLVDGKPFFGDDATTTLKNIPSDIIDRVQVFDQMSDQSQFTKFDDGERNKTLNIVTKADRRNGQFGKLYAGYGTDDRYTAGGNVNFFGGERRISVLGLSNNINQQNFSIQDILGATSGGGGMMGRMMGNVSRMFGSSGGRGGRSFGGGGGVSDFLVSQSDGITASNGLGINYTDSWGKSFSLTGSYFFNYTDNDAAQSSNKQYFLSDIPSQIVVQKSTNSTQNINHRANLRADYTIDSMSSILFSPKLTWQGNDKSALALGSTTAEDTLLNTSDTKSINENTAYNVSGDLLYRLRFATEGRTFSANLTANARKNSGTQNTDALNSFQIGTTPVIDTLLQNTPNSGTTLSYGGNLSFTEPLAKNHQLQLTYNFNTSHSESDRRTYTKDTLTGIVDVLSQRLSNTSTSDYTTHRPGFSYRFTLAPAVDTAAKPTAGMMTMMFGSSGGGRPPGGMGGMGGMMGNVGAWVFNVGMDYQMATLSVDQTFPSSFSDSRNFYNILPSLSINTRLNMFSNLRFSYRTSTNQPTITQLQNVIDNSNPLQISTGNPGLGQEFSHNFNAHYGTFNMVTAAAFFSMINFSVTENKIITATTVVTGEGDSITLDGRRVWLPSGAQFSRPINLNGAMNASAFVVYSFPWEPISGLKLNVNTNANVMFNRDISQINGADNIANSWIATPSLGFVSNISENTDFSLSASSALNTIQNSIQSELNQTYYTHTIRAGTTMILKDSSDFWDGWLLTGDFSYIMTSGFASGYNQSVPLLNLGIGKRILDGQGEFKLSVFDLLNQNNSITRNTGSGYIEDLQTNVLQRYFLLNFTYNLRNWSGGK